MNHYLEIGDMLDEEMDRAIAHMERINKKLSVIDKMITIQQDYSSYNKPSGTIDIAEIIEDALIIQASLMESHAISIVKKIEKVPVVKGQRTKLMCAIMNLIENAKNAMDNASEGNRVLTISTTALDSSVQIAIHDTGHGISEEDLPNIFQKGVLSNKEGGGSGLYYCEGYIREMGGTIRAESPGRGATFIVTLPC